MLNQYLYYTIQYLERNTKSKGVVKDRKSSAKDSPCEKLADGSLIASESTAVVRLF